MVKGLSQDRFAITSSEYTFSRGRAKTPIMEFLKHKVSKSAIARMLGTSRTNLDNYIKTRRLEEPK